LVKDNMFLVKVGQFYRKKWIKHKQHSTELYASCAFSFSSTTDSLEPDTCKCQGFTISHPTPYSVFIQMHYSIYKTVAFLFFHVSLSLLKFWGSWGQS
jgi:hypothetical protein